FDYTEVGVELAKHWHFSSTFCNAIAQQLDPLSYDNPSQAAILTRLSLFMRIAWAAGLPPEMIVQR
ncbi:hypothetical protein V6255_19195, partial [Psychromonas arctica]